MILKMKNNSLTVKVVHVKAQSTREKTKKTACNPAAQLGCWECCAYDIYPSAYFS